MADPVTIWTLDWVPETPRGFVRDLRLRWACEEAGLPYRIATVPFDDRETNHLDRQPFGQVPMLEDGDLRLFESGACVIHLARKGSMLIPADPKAEIEVLQWIMAALNSIEMVTMPWVVLTWSDEEFAGITGWLDKRLAQIEAVLAGREWLVGDTFTVADAYLFVVCSWAAVPGINLKDWPFLNTLWNRIAARPSVKAAMSSEGLVAQ